MNEDFTARLKAALKLAANGQRGDAIRQLEELLSLFSHSAQAWNELGVLYYQEGNKARARDCFVRAVACDNDHPRALTNLGACHNELGDNESAIHCYERALDINPKLADAWGNLGKLWNDQREYEFGAYCYQRALDLERKPIFLRGLGSAYRLSGRYGRAMDLFSEAIASEPDDGFAHTALAALHFYHEDYGRALEEYEWRWALPESAEHKRKYPRLFEKPARRAENFSDKTVLIHTEQGYGDNLLFCRYIPLLREKAAHVIMWCWPGLVDLFADNFHLDLVTSNIDDIGDFDVSIPLLSLPYHLDPHLEYMGGASPYLWAGKAETIEIPADPSVLNVGIVWSCDHTGFDYAYKKVPLDTLAPIFGLPNVRYFSLQLNPDRRELKGSAHQGYITDLAPRLKTFRDTAEVIGQLDLVISVDTSVAHLAAAMGKPTWVLLKKNPDWRWHGYDGHPLWYPEARLFCQHPLDSWQSVVNRLKDSLATFAGNKAIDQGK